MSHLDLRDEVERLRERVQDYEDDARTVLAERCAPDERHCSCVPHLRREVERLRAENEQQAREVAYLRACVPPSHPSDYGYEAWGWRLRAEVAAERAAVVAWLRDYAVPRKIDPDVLALLPPGATVVSHFADEIERGEHRREEPTP